MRTTARLCLVLAVVATGFVALPAAADAARKPGSVKIKANVAHKKQDQAINKVDNKADKAHRRIGRLKQWNFTLQDWNKSQQAAIDTILANVPTITGALTALREGLLAVQAALEGPIATAFADIEDGFDEVSDALNNPVTGLVGLNLARPQFGAFEVDGDIIGATGQNPPAQGPDADAVQGINLGPAGDFEGFYVVDFNNDVSLRALSVNVFPTGPTVPVPTGSAVNCSSTASASAACGAVQVASGGSGAPDADPDKVLVQIAAGTDPGLAANGFSVTALSG